MKALLGLPLPQWLLPWLPQWLPLRLPLGLPHWAQGSQLLAHWPWWTGGLLLTLAAGLHHGLSTPWQARAGEQLAQQQPVAVSKTDLKNIQDVAQTPTTATVAELPTESLSPKRAAALLALAQRQGLATALVQEQTDSSGQLQVSMQGKARYPALRLLVGGALTADPALVLERMSLRRAESTTPELDFELLWTFSHRKPQPESEPKVAERGLP